MPQTIPEEQITYVVFDDDGNLVGKYIQVVQVPHYNYWLPWLPEYTEHWTSYRANAARTALELIPPAEPDPE